VHPVQKLLTHSPWLRLWAQAVPFVDKARSTGPPMAIPAQAAAVPLTKVRRVSFALLIPSLFSICNFFIPPPVSIVYMFFRFDRNDTQKNSFN
jgi:hypothetical protein